MLLKISVFVLMLSILAVLREVLRFIAAFAQRRQFEISAPRTALLWLAIAYIMTVIFCGFVS